ncbi:MAG: hypothetical protein ACK4H7_03110 [Acidilobaceae archaeon]
MDKALAPFMEEIEKLREMASHPLADEYHLRYTAKLISEDLKPLGYVVVVRKRPRWMWGPRFEVIIQRIGSRGRPPSRGGKSPRSRPVELAFYEGPEGEHIYHG